LSKITDVDPNNWDELWLDTLDEEKFCGLCGNGFDTWKEVQIHMFASHYEIVKEDAKEWLKHV
tara:strand:+ start:6340 stop:6528 length:189 start_codon:yes stop_codon:yes gene_type:complete